MAREEANTIYWRCVKVTECNGSAKTSFVDLASIPINSEVEVTLMKTHLHASDQAEIVVKEKMDEMKRRARSEPNEPPAMIVQEVTSTIRDEEVLVRLRERQTLMRGINRWQNSERPQNPQTLGDVQIREPYTLTKSGERFLQLDIEVTDGNKILMFYTEPDLRRLCDSESDFMDGTFSTAPRLFYQLYSIHGVVGPYVYPLIYCLTTRKSQATYTAILTHLRDHATRLGLNFSPRRITCDFEAAAINAVRDVLPECEISGYLCFADLCMTY